MQYRFYLFPSSGLSQYEEEINLILQHSMKMKLDARLKYHQHHFCYTMHCFLMYSTVRHLSFSYSTCENKENNLYLANWYLALKQKTHKLTL